MTEDERGVWAVHFERLQRLLAEGTLILAGRRSASMNTGIVIIRSQQRRSGGPWLMEEDPAIASGSREGKLRPFSVALLRGRDYAQQNTAVCDHLLRDVSGCLRDGV